jgi:hypothetical protein
MQLPSLRDWILLVVDKVLLGGLLVWAGFWLNRRLERWRQRAAATREWSKEEALRISEIVSDFGDLDAATDRCMSAVGAVIEDLKTNAKATDHHELKARASQEEVSTHEQAIRKKLYRFRPWLGKELGQKAFSYLDKNRDLIDESSVVGSHDTVLMADLCIELDKIREAFYAAVRARYGLPAEGGQKATPQLE